MSKTKISVVTVCYNALSSIEKTILSVISQTYSNLEYIIIDGCSTDGTIDVIKKYEGRVTKWISEPDKGIFDAMNKGLDLSTGDWVLFMNAGDVLVSNTIIQSVFKSSELNNYSVIFGDMIAVYPHKCVPVKARPFFKATHKFVPMGFSHQSSIVKLEDAKRIKFDLSYKVTADYNMIYKIFMEGGKLYYYEDVISAVTVDGFSSNNRRLQLQEIGRIVGYNSKMLIQLKIAIYLMKYKLIKLMNRLK